MSLSILDVHADKWEPEPMSGCFLWTGACNSDGYAGAWFNGAFCRVHRQVLSEKLGSAVPAGVHASHLCHTRCCVNPDHLVAESLSANCQRKSREVRGRAGAARRSVALGYRRLGCKFWVRGMVDACEVRLGSFPSEALASAAYQRFRAALASGVSDPAALKAAARGDAL